MCKCTPNKRTPFCGAPGCEWPAPSEEDITEAIKHIKAQQCDHNWIHANISRITFCTKCGERK